MEQVHHMMMASPLSSDVQQQALSVLCERNLTGELIYTPDDDLSVHAKVRFLKLSGDRLIIDHPTVSGRPLHLRGGEIIRVNFRWEGQRFTFTTLVREPTHWSDIGSLAINALSLNVPAKIERNQRRECSRISMLNAPSDTLRFRPIEEAGTSFDGSFMNLSEMGCSVMVEKDSVPPIEEGELYWISFKLPDIPEPFNLIGRIQWFEEVPGGDRIIFGVGWQLDWSASTDRQVQSMLTKYVMIEQLRMLQCV